MVENFSLKDSVEDILQKMKNTQGDPTTIHAGNSFLQHKLQDRLLQKQNKYNAKQLFWTRITSIATLALVIATLLLVVCNK